MCLLLLCRSSYLSASGVWRHNITQWSWYQYTCVCDIFLFSCVIHLLKAVIHDLYFNIYEELLKGQWHINLWNKMMHYFLQSIDCVCKQVKVVKWKTPFIWESCSSLDYVYYDSEFYQSKAKFNISTYYIKYVTQ